MANRSSRGCYECCIFLNRHTYRPFYLKLNSYFLWRNYHKNVTLYERVGVCVRILRDDCLSICISTFFCGNWIHTIYDAMDGVRRIQRGGVVNTYVPFWWCTVRYLFSFHYPGSYTLGLIGVTLSALSSQETSM